MAGRTGLLIAATLLLAAGRAAAFKAGKYRYDPRGKVRAARLLEARPGERAVLVLLVEGKDGAPQTLRVLPVPERPVARTFFAPGEEVSVPLEGPLADAGAVAVGRFGPAGEGRLRFLTPRGLADFDLRGHAVDGGRPAAATLLGRNARRPIVFWDAHADLDGDGTEEIWYPLAAGNGAVRVHAGRPAGDRTLTIEASNTASSSPEHLLARTAYAPNLFPADLEGDGVLELIALRGRSLVAWGAGPTGGAEAVAPSFTLDLPFLETGDLAAEELRTPRIQLADADGDGKTDLLVTLVTGRRDQLGSLKTTLFHFPGPFADASGRLVAPRARLDTESVGLHPRFVDLDGDGALDYLGDAIRGTRWDLIRRVMGAEPTIHFVGFRFDRTAGTFEATPYFTVERPYSSEQAVSNEFGPSAWFTGDFDGDGHKDLLDLGNLGGVEVAGAETKSGAGPGDPVSFPRALVPRVRTEKPLSAAAVVSDLTGDGRADALLWNEDSIFLLVPEGTR